MVEAEALARRGINLAWRDFPDGSGAMAAALTRGELDAALLLTEGAVAGAAQGGRFAIASIYTESPLIWGIHVAPRSRFSTVADLRGARYAISRVGSGSHLMCFVHAKRMAWPSETLQFVTVGGLAGAVAAFEAGTADVFFWEKYMTQPTVDAGHFLRIDEFVAPWPAFVLCIAAHATAELRAALRTALDAALAAARALARDPRAPAEIAARYGLEPEAVRTWLGTTRWADTPGISADVVARVADVLRELGLIAADFDERRLVASLGG